MALCRSQLSIIVKVCNDTTRPLGAGGSCTCCIEEETEINRKIQQFFTISSRARYKSSTSPTIKDQLEWILGSVKRESEYWPLQLFTRVSRRDLYVRIATGGETRG
ncbi:hypothetical protein R3I94_002288 [Phoxinus phoxinus]|uniref:Uncharacterized protein n=1 Tax=Phoxinus phoxinus TaxID=58324 RepID=A0AAN9HDM5_9TELE